MNASENLQIQFTLNIKPFSVNKMYHAKNFSKTQGARNWSASVFQEMNKPLVQQKLRQFREEFKPGHQGIKVSLYFRYPKSKLITKSGKISSRAFDLSNIEKPLIDLLFDRKYFRRNFPDGCLNLNTDDKYITDLQSFKRPSEDGEHSVGVVIETFRLGWN